jgi:hypothetical protein
MPDKLPERWHASLAGEGIPHRHREELLVASAESREREWPSGGASTIHGSLKPLLAHVLACIL